MSTSAMTDSGEVDVDLTAEATMECPYPAYRVLRDKAPVYYDERMKMFVVTRYEDVRAILVDKRFQVIGRRPHPKRDLIEGVYEREGAFEPAPSLSGLNNPQHRAMRAIFNDAFSPRKIAVLAEWMSSLADSLIDDWIDQEQIDFVPAFAVPFPLRVIGRICGIDSIEELTQIKVWADSWVGRLGQMGTDSEVIRATELEVESQRYFQPLIDRLRNSADEHGLLSTVLRAPIDEGGRTVNDAEAHSAIMQTLFVAGHETVASALATGMQTLAGDAELMSRLRANPTDVANFAEEILRIESPAQGMFRQPTEDVRIHGVTLPAGSVINIRFGAANRDERRFDDPDAFRLDRPNQTAHLAFGQGTHLCLGAPLSRLELRIALTRLVDRLERVWFVDGANDFAHSRNLIVRGLNELHIGFTVAAW